MLEAMNFTFSRKQRLGVYAFAFSLATALVAFGLLEAELVAVLMGMVWAASNMLALFNLTPDDDPTEQEIAGEVGEGQP